MVNSGEYEFLWSLSVSMGLCFFLGGSQPQRRPGMGRAES